MTKIQSNLFNTCYENRDFHFPKGIFLLIRNAFPD